MRLWPEGSPKLRMGWTDPPYGVDYAAKNRYLNHSDRGNRIQKPIINDQPAEAHATCAGALELARGRALAGASCYVAVPSGPTALRLYRGAESERFHLPTIVDLGETTVRDRDERLSLSA